MRDWNIHTYTRRPLSCLSPCVVRFDACNQSACHVITKCKQPIVCFFSFCLSHISPGLCMVKIRFDHGLTRTLTRWSALKKALTIFDRLKKKNHLRTASILRVTCLYRSSHFVPSFARGTDVVPLISQVEKVNPFDPPNTLWLSLRWQAG